MNRTIGYLTCMMGILVTIACSLVGQTQGQSIAPVQALRASDFLDSIGTQSAISVRGENFDRTISCAKYLGARWFRAGIEGHVPVEQFLELHKQAGLKFSWGLGSGGTDLPTLLTTGKQMAAAGALIGFEGPNEPNNWGFKYQGKEGGKALSWIPIATLQRELYSNVKNDPILKSIPVWSISENGAETDNVGLQFLTIPQGSKCSMPDGTKYADYANVHNYIYHPNSPKIEDNKTWNAADPGSGCKVDGLYGEYGRTWRMHYAGYSGEALEKLPRVTTETGCTIDGPVTEDVHALNLLSIYLDQYKRGWSYTCVYLLRDRVDEAGNQQFGFYKPDYSARKAATYLHNLTTILADSNVIKTPGKLAYTIADEPNTVHDMLLQKGDSSYWLVIWDERTTDSDKVTIKLGKPVLLAKTYDPTVGPAPIQLNGATSSLELTLTNHPLIISLR